jgi:hypothetical protein
MKKIIVLFWEGSDPPRNNMGADITVYKDPSDDSGLLSVIINNIQITCDLEDIFYDEMLKSVSETEFDTFQEIEDLKLRFDGVFKASFIESTMSPINGVRVTTQDSLSLN